MRLSLPFCLVLISCSFPVSTALRIAITFLMHLDLRERDSIPARTFSFLNATLVASYPLQSSTSDALSTLIKACHHIIISTPVSLLESLIFAIQAGLAVWIEDKRFSLQGEAYNDLVRNFHFLLSLYSLLSYSAAHASLRIVPSAFTTTSAVCDFSERPFAAPYLCVLAHSIAGPGTSRVSMLLLRSALPLFTAGYLVQRRSTRVHRCVYAWLWWRVAVWLGSA